MQVEKFFFTTAYYGEELREWSNRAELLNNWRRVADSVGPIHQPSAIFLMI